MKIIKTFAARRRFISFEGDYSLKNFDTTTLHPSGRYIIRPFLKWAGGKTKLLPVLRPLVPKSYERYFEPFVGGGALFFDLQPSKAILSDANEELINCYRVVKESPTDLLRALSSYEVSEEEYYRVRLQDASTLPAVVQAARMIFLNKTCFNGLYRVNRLGRFNVPFGRYKNVCLVDEGLILATSAVLQRATLKTGSYDNILQEEADKGDFIYLDPPYLPISIYSDFKRYTSQQFYEDDHKRLSQVFRELDGRGCRLLLSNSFHPNIRKLYKEFKVRTAYSPRFINCKGDRRGLVKELLITNY